MNSCVVKVRPGSLPLAAFISGLTLTTLAGNYIWSGAEGRWGEANNWIPAGIPAAGDHVYLVNSGHEVTSLVDVAQMQIASLIETNFTHTLDLHNTSLTIKNLIINAGPELGSQAITNSGTLAFVNSGDDVAELIIKEKLRLAHDFTLPAAVGAGTVANMTISSNINLYIGSEIARGQLRIADSDAQWSSCHRQASLVVKGGFYAWLSALQLSAGTKSFSGTVFTSMLDLSEATGFIDATGNVFNERYGPATVILGDQMDFYYGNPQVPGGAFSPPALGNLVLGKGNMYIYATKYDVRSGDLIATNITDGALSIKDVLSLCGGGLTFDLPNYKVLLSDGIAFSLGAPENYATWDSGYGTYGFTNEFRMGANKFEAFLGRFSVGKCTRPSDSRMPNRSVIDLRSTTAGVLVVTNEFSIGAVTGVYNPSKATSTKYISTLVALGDNFATTIGTPNARATINIADGDGWVANEFQSGGTFHAFLSRLIVGRMTASPVATALVVMDLSAVTNGTLDVAGDTLIGVGPTARAVVKLPSFVGTMKNLTVGATNSMACGKLELAGTHLTVTGDVHLNGPELASDSLIYVETKGFSAGLDLTAEATLDVGAGLINIKFGNVENYTKVYWGLRWAGDHVAELEAMLEANPVKLSWDDTELISPFVNAVGVFTDGNYTYVGTSWKQQGTTLIVR